MNKKTAVALAVGAAFAAPVFAQSTGSTIEIYGRLYPELSWTKSKGASGPGDVNATLVAGDGDADANHKGRGSVDVSGSRIGFRGTERLGGSLAAIWQVETRVRFDTGTNAFFGNGRNSFLGLRGGFGTVKLGNMDTVYKEYGAQVGSFFGVSSSNFVSTSNVLSTHGLGYENSDAGDLGFHFRAPNSIQYETPEFGDFQAAIQFSPDELKGNPTRGSQNTNTLSMGVKYEAGPLYASIQHERHNDWFDVHAQPGFIGSSAEHTRDNATRLSVGFGITPQHKITGDLAFMQWKDRDHATGAAGEFEEYKRRSWAVGWEAKWGGPWQSEIAYVRANDGECSLTGGADCSTDGLKSSMISAGVGYALSKRSLVFALANRLTNGASAMNNNTANLDTGRGADITIFAVGISHSF